MRAIAHNALHHRPACTQRSCYNSSTHRHILVIKQVHPEGGVAWQAVPQLGRLQYRNRGEKEGHEGAGARGPVGTHTGTCICLP